MAAVGHLTDCPICMDKLHDPKFLPCHHTFCRECVENLHSSRGRSVAVPCPLCRMHFTVPSDGAYRLPPNSHAEELVQVSYQLETTQTDVGMLETELATVRLQLEENRSTRSTLMEMAEEKLHISTQLDVLQDRLSVMEQQLEASKKETAAEKRETAIHKMQVAALKVELNESISKLQQRQASLDKVVRKKLRLNTKLAETTSKLTRLQNRMSEMEKQLQLQEKDLHAAEAKEWSLQQQQKETLECLIHAERCHQTASINAENCRQKVEKLETSLKKARNSCQNAHQKLEQISLENSSKTATCEAQVGELQDEIVDLKKQLDGERLKHENNTDHQKAHTEVVRLCFVLLAIVFLITTGTLVLLEEQTKNTVQVSNREQLACSDVAKRLEKYAVKLTTARFNARETQRQVNECTQQLAAAQNALEKSEVSLKDAKKSLLVCEESDTPDGAEKSTLAICKQQLTQARADLDTKDKTLKDHKAHSKQECDNGIQAVSAKFVESSLQLNDTQKRLKTMAVTLTECSNDLTQNAELLKQYKNRLKRAENAVKEFTERREKGNCEGKDVPTTSKSTKLSEDLSTALEASRVKTKQLETCTLQLNETQKRLKTMTVTLTECTNEQTRNTELLKQYKNRLKRAENAVKELTERSKDAPTLTECTNELTQNTELLKQYKNRLKRAESAVKELTERREKGCEGKDVTTTSKSRKTCEDRSTAIEAARVKTKQLETCTQDLIKAREKVDTLTKRQSDADSTYRKAQLRQRREMEEIEAEFVELQWSYKRKLEQELAKAVLSCESEHFFSIALGKTVMIFPILLIYVCLFTPIGYRSLMFFANHVRRFWSLIGLRKPTFYRVGFRRPRHR